MVLFFWWGIQLFNEDGFAIVELNDKWNFIDVNGKLISEPWFDYISYFENGIANVKLNNKYNFIDIYGKLVSQQWFNSFDEASDYLINL